MKTVLEVIKATTAYFEKHGIESPRLNIEHLLAHVLGKRRMDLYLEFDRPLSDAELEPLRLLVKRRAGREPLQHLLGTVEFCGRSFKSDGRALIPRPETEQLCELIIANFNDRNAVPQEIVDVGTGSGVIAITMAVAFPSATVEAIDLSADAICLAGENLAQHGLTERVTVRLGDLLQGTDEVYDLIVANLPYIDSGECRGLSPEVQRDPALALDGGVEGLELFARFIPQVAAGRLSGLLALEIGADQGPALRKMLEEHKFQDIRVLSDYQGRDRFVFATYG